MAEPPRLVRSDDPVGEAGCLLASSLERVDARGPGVRLAIPGGSALAALGVARSACGGVWSRLRLTWVDERCAAFESADSNRGAAYRSGHLDPKRPPAAELPLFLEGESGQDAVARVEAGLDIHFGGALDLLLLGMGEDGHVASIFPGREPPPEARVAWIRESPKPPPERITLARRVLATAETTLLVAAGESKRAALTQLMSGDPALPAHGLPGLIIVTDLDLGGCA